MINGVIFDLDGTLIDSMQVWYDVDRIFLMENGVKNPPRSISERVKKMTIYDASSLFISEFNLSCTQDYVIERIRELVRIEYEENIQMKPYVMEFLDFLDRRGIPYGVATATYKSLAEAVLRRCGIYKRLKFLLSSADYPNGKQFPDIFLGAAEILETPPECTLVAEDSLHCIETAKNAGFITAAIYDKASEADICEIRKKSDYYFENLKEMESII
ncbi:MAG: HAD family phosphatase [Ruminococcus sp.]|nr:HAD family phosphatase [Ruminococcus sp.]MDE6784542.1 HAD family phosphatase [Ruminococcus sp.]